MAWSYRQDRSDEVYTEGGGPAILEGEQTGETPAPEMVMDKKLREKEQKPKEGVLTQFQQFPGQNVPRIIEGDGETEKDKEIVKAAKADEKQPKVDPARQAFLDAERTRIRTEEQNKVAQEELDEEREKIRKEVQADMKKSTTSSPKTNEHKK